jgi:hypothetical protein
MRFQKMIRIQLMVVGLGAGLLLAKPVFAQQDTDPTLFEETADATHPDQAAFNVAPPPEAVIRVTAYAAAPSSAQEVDEAQLTALDVKTVFALMIGIGSIVLLGMAEAVRGSRRRTWRERDLDGLPSGLTAN